MAAPIDYPAWSFWRDFILIACAAGSTVYTWWSNREKVTSKRFAALEESVKTMVSAEGHQMAEEKRDALCDRHKAELHKANLRIQELPTREEIRNLSKDIGGLGEKLGRMEGRLEGLGRLGDLMNEFLINQGGKR